MQFLIILFAVVNCLVIQGCSSTHDVTVKKTPLNSNQSNRGDGKMTELEKGDAAPDFCLNDQDGKTVKLSDFKGRKLLLYFYPRADTPGCTTQACSIRDSFKDLTGKRIASVGISPDLVDDQKKFAAKFNLPFQLLADEEHKVAEAYGVWGEKSMYGKTYMGIIRSSFLIDEKGVIIQAWYKVKPEDTVPNAIDALK
jgi:peroxiredoxin Q/BCP